LDHFVQSNEHWTTGSVESTAGSCQPRRLQQQVTTRQSQFCDSRCDSVIMIHLSSCCMQQLNFMSV